jgi:hypothetical protein
MQKNSGKRGPNGSLPALGSQLSAKIPLRADDREPRALVQLHFSGYENKTGYMAT